MKKLFALVGLLMLSGCGEPQEITYRHVVRVMMHEPHRYTVFTKDPESPELSMLQFRYSSSAKVKLIVDVEEGQEMWIKKRECMGELEVLEFHIHSPKDIEGGGWSHGKAGRGQTQVIE